jgi:hypothetical protein
MSRVIRLAFSVLLMTASAAQATGMCNPDGSPLASRVAALKLMKLHFLQPTLTLAQIKALAPGYTVTFTEPSCTPDGQPLPWDQLNVQVVPIPAQP